MTARILSVLWALLCLQSTYVVAQDSSYPPPRYQTPAQLQAAVSAGGFARGVYSQVGKGPSRDGASAAGAKVSLMGTGKGTAAISCPYAGASWLVKGGGVFSTFATPGNITPEVSFGAGAVSVTITNAVANANNSRWTGDVQLTCVTVGTSGTMLASGIGVNYATGVLADGAAPLNNGGNFITMDNTGSMPVTVSVTMATANAANVFRLDVLTITQTN